MYACFSDENECLAFPCRNGGNCTNTLGSYTCTCPTQWSGQNCDLGMYTIKISNQVKILLTTQLN